MLVFCRAKRLSRGSLQVSVVQHLLGVFLSDFDADEQFVQPDDAGVLGFEFVPLAKRFLEVVNLFYELFFGRLGVSPELAQCCSRWSCGFHGASVRERPWLLRGS